MRVSELREGGEAMSELDGFEVIPYINLRTNKGKIASRDKRIEQLEGEIGGTRTTSIPSLAFNYVDNKLESIGCQGELYVRQRTVPAELDYVEDKSRWFELFGTPERAARTLYYDKEPICAGCALLDECGKTPDEEHDTCFLIDYDALLEWLEGESE